MNHLAPRVFQYSEVFYFVVKNRKRKICFGKRPGDLFNTETINQRVWEQHRTYLNRFEKFPLEKAEYYQKLKESTGISSIRGLSEITGEDWSYIARILKTFGLPQPIQDFLHSNRNNPFLIKQLHLRKLLEIVHLREEERQFLRFRAMLLEIGLVTF